MPTIDLSTPPPPPDGVLDALPRRAALTLPELRLVAEHAGGAPLPFDLVDGAGEAGQSAIEDRLGTSRGTTEDQAYAAALAALHEPTSSLERRGLLVDGSADDGLIGAVGLLATPELAVDLDVVVDGVQAKVWQRQAGDAVASLSTVDGLVFELSWFPSSSWSAELGRVPALSSDHELGASQVPAVVELPYELADAATEAARTSRQDLVPALVAQHEGAVVGADGEPLDAGTTGTVLGALVSETHGRLRALAADVSGAEPTSVGVVSWVLLADGWHALRPVERDGAARVEIRKVGADALATDLSPVLAEVAR